MEHWSHFEVQFCIEIGGTPIMFVIQVSAEQAVWGTTQSLDLLPVGGGEENTEGFSTQSFSLFHIAF
mgnify:CR=1 FL=1